DKTLELVDKMSHARLIDVFDAYSFFEDNKDHVNTVLDIMLLAFRDMLVAKMSWKENILINSDKKDMIFNNVSGFSPGRIIKGIEVIEETRKNIKRNINYQLSIEVMLMKLQEE
ncbi:MAG: DNA polymerase III subunit delta', partial [Clostridia bacterium]|nr:DNA polymerase III subunit delta' [Clostridia bacterium]